MSGNAGHDAREHRDMLRKAETEAVKQATKYNTMQADCEVNDVKEVRQVLSRLYSIVDEAEMAVGHLRDRLRPVLGAYDDSDEVQDRDRQAHRAPLAQEIDGQTERLRDVVVRLQFILSYLEL